MSIVKKIINIPQVWDLIQTIFGDNSEKMRLYRSVIGKPGKLLDFGCANGNTFPIFSQFEYYGCDIDPVMIDNAKKKFSKYKNAHFLTVDILSKKFPTNGFDNILFGLTGHHQDDETLLKLFAKLGTLLGENGKIHYFDSIRSPQTDHLATKLLIYLDRGKFIRHKSEYVNIKKKLSNKLKITREYIYQVTNTFFPQPKYLYWRIERKR
jgi:SAM-dependent methyltransferase